MSDIELKGSKGKLTWLTSDTAEVTCVWSCHTSFSRESIVRFRSCIAPDRLIALCNFLSSSCPSNLYVFRERAASCQWSVGSSLP